SLAHPNGRGPPRSHAPVGEGQRRDHGGGLGRAVGTERARPADRLPRSQGLPRMASPPCQRPAPASVADGAPGPMVNRALPEPPGLVAPGATEADVVTAVVTYNSADTIEA